MLRSAEAFIRAVSVLCRNTRMKASVLLREDTSEEA